MFVDFLHVVKVTTERKPKIIIASEEHPDRVLYALSELHAAELLKETGFETSPRQIAVSLNPRIKQAKYITRHSDVCATITHGDVSWRLLRVGGRHRDRTLL